ncbi:MAG: tRNA (N(6)-L-threonylcarbamoyladenosine(37)-C(2))-methylthiotransferase MtaB [Bacteroidia bacterium]|nr:tRNA (N(6)-L-threonylcarbamoyladenosine(37)-C(2))-methylthiotransferase MtaB [Bacteroidia bacterium]
MKSFHIYTLGCKLNFSESSAIAKNLADEGYERVNFEDGADVYVINTCSVTDHADRKCKKVVAQAKKHNPDAFIAIVGCYAQLKPEEIARIQGVDVVLGAAEKFNISSYLLQGHPETPLVRNGNIKDVKDYTPAFSSGDRTRTFLKVQDGCDYFCTFCTIPLARGKSRNASVEETVQKAREAVAGGAKEIVLTGVNIGDFGQSTGETFFELVKALDREVDVPRFRISSIEPNLLSDEIIAYCAQSSKFVPHFHIPLQSGNNDILKKMRRKYERELYAERVSSIRRLMPDACIGVDVITGFPSEGEEEFLDTYRFINELDVSYLHVFTYSERSNTGALKIKGKVPVSIRKDRTNMLRILSEKKRRAFYDSQLGKTWKVLFEAENDGEWMHGFTENYLKVKMPYDPLYINEIREARMLEQDSEGVMTVRLTNREDIPESIAARMADA